MIALTSTISNISEMEKIDRCISDIAQNAGHAALEQLYLCTKDAVFGCALSILKNTYDAEDVLHDCCLSVWQSAHHYRSDGKPMAWIFTIVRNLCLDKLRRRSRFADLPEEDWEPYLESNERIAPEDRIVLEHCLRNLAPDILESVLDDCGTQKGQVIIMQEKKKTSRLGKVLAGTAAALMLIVGMGVYHGNTAAASTVMPDVNPSIGITVNKGEKVLEVTPLNEDAEAVVGEMDFSGCSLEVTVNALIGSMLRCGYISDAANSVLVTVDHDDPAAGQKMQEKLMTEINAILESGNIAGAVLGQTVTDDDETRQLAEQYGITSGKAQLIRQITAQNPLYSFEELVPLTINELNLIAESGGKKLENVESIGSASSSGYIGEVEAVKAAMTYAGINGAHETDVKWHLRGEGSTMVYDVE